MDESLRSIYFNVSNPASFFSREKLFLADHRINPNVSREYVKDWLKSNFTYTLHYPARRYFDRNPTVVRGSHIQAQADLADMSQYAQQNDGIKYILTFIDCFSRYAFAVPVKSKHASNILEALKSILTNYQIEVLQTDRGTEFKNSQVEKLVKSYGIEHWFTNNQDIKCALVERFNRTLKARMFKYFTAKGTRRYIDVLPQLVDSYNHSIHRTLGISPVEVSRENEQELFARIYGFEDEVSLRSAALIGEREKPKFKKGDWVRVK